MFQVLQRKANGIDPSTECSVNQLHHVGACCRRKKKKTTLPPHSFLNCGSETLLLSMEKKRP